MITQQIIPVTHINQISIQPTQIMTSAVPSINSKFSDNHIFSLRSAMPSIYQDSFFFSDVPIKTTIYTLPLPVDPNEVSKNFIQQAAAASGLTASSTAVNILNNTNIMVTQQRLNNGNINRGNLVNYIHQNFCLFRAPLFLIIEIFFQLTQWRLSHRSQQTCKSRHRLFRQPSSLLRRHHLVVEHSNVVRFDR